MTVEEATRARREAILAEYAEEEAEAAEVEVAENAAALDVPLNLRVTKALDGRLRQRAAAEKIPVSALVRRLLMQSMQERPAPEMTMEQVEAIARRIAEETVAAQR